MGSDRLNKYQSYVEAGGHNSVEQNQRKYRIGEVIKLITKGWSRTAIIEHIQELWDIKKATNKNGINFTKSSNESLITSNIHFTPKSK